MIDTCRLSTNTVPYLRSIRKEASSKIPHMLSISELTKGKSAASPYISRLKDVFVQIFRVFTARPAAVDPIIAPCFSPWGEVRMEDIDTVPMDPSMFKYFEVWSRGLRTHSECMYIYIYIEFMNSSIFLGWKKSVRKDFSQWVPMISPANQLHRGGPTEHLGQRTHPLLKAKGYSVRFIWHRWLLETAWYSTKAFGNGRHIACASGFSSLVPRVFPRLCLGCSS